MPASLRQDIDKYRRARGESLAEYLRKAAMDRIKKEKKQKIDLKKLAEEVVGSVDPKKSGWAGLDVVKWQQELRRQEDEHMLRKLGIKK